MTYSEHKLRFVQENLLRLLRSINSRAINEAFVSYVVIS